MTKEENKINKGDTVYYARLIPDIEEVRELKIRTAKDDYYVGVDELPFLFTRKDIGETIFFERLYAINKLMELRGENNNGEN